MTVTSGKHLGHGGALGGGQGAARLRLHPGNGLRRVDGSPRRGALQQVQELGSDTHFGPVERGQ
jgi:hypothetical protein